MYYVFPYISLFDGLIVDLLLCQMDIDTVHGNLSYYILEMWVKVSLPGLHSA